MSLPNGTRIPISLSGDIELSSKLKLKNVLFVPSFSFNVLLVSALVSNSHLTVSFFTGHFVIQDQVNKEMIGKGDRVKELYVLDTTTLDTNFPYNAFLSSSSKFSIHVNRASAQTWHNRLGHLSSKSLDCL